MKRLIHLGLLAILLIALFSPIAYAEDVTADYTDELCTCLIYHAHKQYNLGVLNREQIITYTMNACYKINFLQAQAYAPNSDPEIALDMMHSEDVERAYEQLATTAVDFVFKYEEQGKEKVTE